MRKEEKQDTLFEYNSEDVRSGAVTPSTAQPAPRMSVKTRRRIYIITVAAISVLLALFVVLRTVNCVNEALVMELSVGDFDATQLTDGVYSGQYASSHLSATVSVTVVSGFVIDITLTAFSGIDTTRAATVFNAVIAAQSLQTFDPSVGSCPSDIILLYAIGEAMEGGTSL